MLMLNEWRRGDGDRDERRSPGEAPEGAQRVCSSRSPHLFAIVDARQARCRQDGHLDPGVSTARAEGEGADQMIDPVNPRQKVFAPICANSFTATRTSASPHMINQSPSPAE